MQILPLLLASLLGGVEITGGTDCPTASQVAERLHALLPPTSTRADRATLEVQGDELRIELHAADGALVGKRTLGARGTCGDQAEAVAVTIAAWEGDLDGGAVPPRRLPPPVDVPP